MTGELGPHPSSTRDGWHNAYNRLMNSCADLETARRRVESTAVASGRKNRLITAELLARLAASPRSSIALRDYAARVDAGECAWNRVELDARPVPLEVAELKADPHVEWPHNWPPVDGEPYRIDWQ